MTFEIIPTKSFIKDLKKVDALSLKRIKKKMKEISENPERYKHLKGPLNNYCRIRIGKLRVLFSYDIEKMELYPERIVFDHNY